IDEKVSVGHEISLSLWERARVRVRKQPLRPDFATLGATGAGVGGSFAVIGFFVRAMRFGHDVVLRVEPPDYQVLRQLRRQRRLASNTRAVRKRRNPPVPERKQRVAMVGLR